MRVISLDIISSERRAHFVQNPPFCGLRIDTGGDAPKQKNEEFLAFEVNGEDSGTDRLSKPLTSHTLAAQSNTFAGRVHSEALALLAWGQ
jgi:hypothetical protein